MLKLKKLTADEILNIPKDSPEKLFSISNWKQEKKLLFSIWHPDNNTDPNIDVTLVFAHINNLAEVAKHKILTNTWSGPNELMIKSSNGKMFRFSYRKMHEFELGKMYIGHTKICYVLNSEFEDLFNNGINAIKSIKYANKQLEDEFKKYIPVIVQSFVNADIGHVLIIEKSTDLVMLDDLIEYMPDKKIPPKHSMWIVSSLSNLICFFDVSKIVHLAITPQTVFVSPQNHICMVLGGWWYTRRTNERMIALPSQLLNVLPSAVFKDKLAKPQYDRQLVKSIGLYSLGDKTMTGSSLLKDNNIPTMIVKWLQLPVSDDSVSQYVSWQDILIKAYGKRTFVQYDVDITKIY